jgi:type IV secretory pathway VirB2 component (pilin)
MLTITAEMLQPITDAITGNLATLLPIGITIMGIMIGVSLIPRIIYKFF